MTEKHELTPRENALIAYRHGVPRWIPCTYTDAAIFMANPGMERYCGFETGTDGFGVSWTFEPNSAACMTTPGARPVLEDVADWKSVVRFPDLEAVDWEKQADIDMHTDFGAFAAGRGLIPCPDGARNIDGGKLRICLVLNGCFERLHALMGMQGALVALMTDPDACFDFFSAMADYKIAYFKKIARYYPVDIINAHDDYGANDRMFMSPETWRELIKPHLKRMVDAVHELGLIYQHHSCGYIEPIIGDLVEMGVDALDPLQACNTRAGELKKQYGDRLTFCGGFDSNGILGKASSTPEQIRAEYRRGVDLLAPGGSYVICPCGASRDSTPVFLDEHFKYGMGFYSR